MEIFKVKLGCLLFLLPLLLSEFNMDAQVQPRDIVWCNGTSQTSNGWAHFRQEMQSHGSQFNNLLDNQWANAWGQGILAGANYIDNRIDLNSGNNVLGIGHGFGGIALRYAQQQNSKISAMILSGVPNQGSNVIRLITENDPSAPGNIIDILQTIEEVKSRNNCRNCNITELTKSWLNTIEGGSNYIGELSQGNEIIREVNQPSMLPSVPYIVITGTAENLSLTRILDTKFSIADSDDLYRCQDVMFNEKSKLEDQLGIQRKAERNNGFFANVKSYAKSIFSNKNLQGSTVDLLSSISTYIAQQATRIYQDILIQRELESGFSQMLRCKLINQVMEAEWMLTVSNESFLKKEVSIDMTTKEDLIVCELNCKVRFPNDPNSMQHCKNWCMQNMVEGKTSETTVFVFEPNNGFLSKSEQELRGENLVAEIHLPNINHFQMSMPTHSSLVNEFKDNIFSGTLGAAFMVPTN